MRGVRVHVRACVRVCVRMRLNAEGEEDIRHARPLVNPTMPIPSGKGSRSASAGTTAKGVLPAPGRFWAATGRRDPGSAGEIWPAAGGSVGRVAVGR